MSEDNKVSNKNILQIVPTLNCGGVERGTIDIAISIREANGNPFVLSSGGSLSNKIKEVPATLIKANTDSKNPFTIWWNIGLIEKIIKENNLDIVHARSRAPAWSAYYATRRTKTPFITTFHGIYSMKTSIKRYYNSVMTFGDRVIAVSNFVKKHILQNYKVNEDIIRVIHRGADLEYFTPYQFDEKQKEKFTEKYNLPASCPLIVMPSRMTSWKGQHVLIDALAKIKDKDFYCILVGDLAKHPNYVQRLKAQIMAHKLQSKVQLFGSEKDIVGLYNRADIVISASIEPEAFGRTIVEAQAMKKLVIATNIGGAAETVHDQETGFHVLPNNSDDMAEKIKYALSILGSKEAEKITDLARLNVQEHFSLKKMQDDTLKVYSELL